jgi:hypothetical protein
MVISISKERNVAISVDSIAKTVIKKSSREALAVQKREVNSKSV